LTKQTGIFRPFGHALHTYRVICSGHGDHNGEGRAETVKCVARKC